MNLPIIDGLLRVTVVAGASRTMVRSIEGDVVRIALAAVPEKGKANKELCSFLKKEFGLIVRVKSGSTSRQKILAVID